MKLAAFLLFLFSVSASAQSNLVAYAEGPCCRVVWQNGKASYLIQDNDLSILVSAPSNYSASLHSVWISIRQDGDTAFDIDPTKFSAIADDPAQTLIPYLDMDIRAERERHHRAVISGVLLALSAGASGAAASTPQTATVNNSNGTSSTITYTDPNAQANVNAQAAANGAAARANIRENYEAKTSGLLRHTTSSKGVIVSGTVYFEGPKHMKATKKGFTPLIHIDLPINGKIYRF